MANRADVVVKNVSNKGVQVVRKLVEGVSDLEIALEKGTLERIHLPGPEVVLIIQAPSDIDTKDSLVKVRSDVDLTVAFSRTHSTWTFKIEPNDLPPDAPASVNVTIGDDEGD
jgi:hypothetical protein